MAIVRFSQNELSGARVGVTAGQSVYPLPYASISDMLKCRLDELKTIATGALDGRGIAMSSVRLLAPIDGHMLVWAAGVTYRRSLDARIEESRVPDVYDRVYGADRPELFLKAVPWKVVTTGDAIAIRRDSDLNVPEPELALIINRYAEIVGYTVCNDVSSRSIEAANPLYLPQAKIYDASCAIASGITPTWEVPRWRDLVIGCTVTRLGSTVWSGEVSTSRIGRDLEDLVDYLWRDQTFDDGVILSTGTGLVPDITFTLDAGDVVTVEISGLPTLVNMVKQGGAL